MKHITKVRAHMRKGKLVKHHTRKTSKGEKLFRIALGTGIVLVSASVLANVLGRMRH
jgi:hypothetical protein